MNSAGGEPPAKRRRGAQPGNRLAQTHGRHSREANSMRKLRSGMRAEMRAVLRNVNQLIAAQHAARKMEGKQDSAERRD